MQNAGDILAQSNARTHEVGYSSPIMLHFARILIEIETGQAVVDSDTELPDGKRLRDLLFAVIKSELEGQISQFYRQAINGCLDFGFDRMFAPGGSSQAKDQHTIRTNIISKLEANYKIWASAEPNNLSLRLDLNQADLAPEASARTSLLVNAVTPVKPVSATPSLTSLKAKPEMHSDQMVPGVSFFKLFDDEVEIESTNRLVNP